MVPLQQSVAEEIALKAVSWIVADEELLAVFLGSTGASAGDLRARLSEPEFLGSVLEFLTMDDAWVLAFCAAENLPPERPLQARMSLPGGAQEHWT